MDLGIIQNPRLEIIQLSRGREFAINQKIGRLNEGGFFGQLFDAVTAIT